MKKSIASKNWGKNLERGVKKKSSQVKTVYPIFKKKKKKKKKKETQKKR